MKVCIISHYDLTLKDSGGSVRTYNLAKILAEQRHEVSVIIPGENNTGKSKDKILVKKISGILPYQFLKVFSKLLGVANVTSLYLYDISFFLRFFPIILNSDIIQIDAPAPLGALTTLFLTKVFRKQVVVDSHDTFQALRIEHSKVLRKILELFMEKIVYRWATLILTVSEIDKKILIEYGVRESKIVVIPNGVDTSALSKFDVITIKASYNLKGFSIVTFVGNMEYSPNQEAVDLIATKLAPEVLSKIHNVKFLLVGRKPPKLTPMNPNLTFTGFVPDIAQLLAVSDVAIAPLLHGSGTRLKILEYLSCGLPVVSTSIGVEGLNVVNEDHLLIEDDMDKFALKVINLLQDEKLRKRLGNAGRELVIKEYNWLNIGKKLDAVYRELKSNYTTRDS